ncbi:MAG TPA: transglutaminase family protein, partial [Polyangiales bacterium]
QVLRQVGFAARFVSGYSIQLKADQKPESGPAGVEQDCTDLHAWAEVYMPGAGWIGLDATSGLLCGEGHIPLACTADPSSAAPVTGSYGWEPASDDDEIEEKFAFEMSVTRLEDRPRPTKPYSDEQWQALLACGAAVDQALDAGDVRLTMGGEPTFVAIDDPDGDEWNTTALGPTKENYADKLVRRLQHRFAPGAFLQHGQGKWYPGEPLPRWAYSCYFRKDGEPLWQDPALFADKNTPEVYGSVRAQQFVATLARQLGLPAGFAVPGYEDVFYHLWRERRLPVNVDPLDSKLADPQERARLKHVFEQGLSSVVGYALPVLASYDEGELQWASSRWFLRDERMYLIPGDSPMGYRLPLDSLPWSAPEDRLEPWERDPMAARPPLPSRKQVQAEATVRSASATGSSHAASTSAAAPTPGVSATGVVRTALCIEPRGGILRVFMPPLGLLEEYVALLHAVEATATELGQPIQLEGYHPPSDDRLSRIQVTPDPGVIEVNIHPASSWDELVANTTALYDEAKACRLASDKFMLDGRHCGTGGGNHITLGGATASDSPFLRRPDLLRSFTSYWLNHPSLSYLFSGLFVGPTSQAPRLDEARQDSLYELEIAYGALAEHADAPPPWLVDRVFRHLLVDVTGNTHRTELCIDKLYSPDSASGRQGLIELRAFEMPPDARMSCAAQLLVRGLLAWFWREPYRQPLARWGTSLVDRFMLPHFVAQDVRDVARDLAQAGFAFDQHWLDPQYEFRFPLIGRVAVDGATLELRQAIEPWHVLGEQPGGGGTVRYVDSSVERLQVLASNVHEARHLVTCNGRRVPLQPTGTAGEYVAGVRYRAWQPDTALHPTIGVHAPLSFDLLDTWSDRSLGGGTYHVAHPGGLAHDNFPRNALEAESRRIARFFAFGHSHGKQPAPPAEVSRELPLTLDLRRAPKGRAL